MELATNSSSNKKRSHLETSEEDKESPFLSEPDAKRPKMIDLTEAESTEAVERDSNGEYASSSASSSEDDEEGPPKHPASWWRDFHSVPAEFHTAAILAKNEQDFLQLVLPPVKPKWNNKVMYAMSYVACRSTSTWTHYSCVTKEEDIIIKAFIAANPDFEICLGSLEGKHSEVYVTWKDAVDWESSNPRDLQEHNPDFHDWFTEQVLTRAKLQAEPDSEDDE